MRQDSTQRQVSAAPTRARNSWSSILNKVITGFLVFWALLLPCNSRAATAHRVATLTLQVEPAAAMIVRPEILTGQLNTRGNEALVSIELTLRMNPGTTAALWLYPASGEPPTLLLTVSQNGRYSVTTTVPSGVGSASSTKTRIELRSSDQALSVSKTL